MKLTGNIVFKGNLQTDGGVNLTTVYGGEIGGWTGTYTVYPSLNDANAHENSLGDDSLQFPYVAGADPFALFKDAVISRYPGLVAA